MLQSHLNVPDNKVHEANMGLIWGRQDPGGPHVGPMNFAIWGVARTREHRVTQSRTRLKTNVCACQSSSSVF